MRRHLFSLGAAMSVSACFALTDDISGIHGPVGTTDAGSEGGSAAGPPRANEDLALSFTTMYQHVTQLFEFVVVDDSNNVVQTRGIVFPPLKMIDGQFKISVPQAIPNRSGPYRIDLWADFSLDGKYNYDHAYDRTTPPLNDHSWRISLDDKAPFDPLQAVTHTSGRYDIHFIHNYGFVDINQFPDPHLPKNPPIEPGVPAVVHIDNLPSGKMVQFRIADPSRSGHVVGLFRFRSSASKDFIIPGCVESAQYYDVDLYVDANDNNDANGNGYDDPSKGPGNDLGWRLLHQPADDTALHVTFDAADTATGNVDIGPP